MFPEFSLSKRERLLKPEQFKHIFNNGNRLRFKEQLILFEKNNTDINRVAFVVPKSMIKLAVDRNHARRLLREAYRLNKDTIGPGLDIIFYIKKPLKNFKEAEKIVLSLCR